MLHIYAPVAIEIGLFSITAAILQGINKQKLTILSLSLGILLKIFINIPLIEVYQAEGVIISTAISYLFSIIINLLGIKYYSGYRFKVVFRRCLLIITFTIIMSTAVLTTDTILSLFINEKSRGGSVFRIVMDVTIGLIIYFYLSVRSNLFVRLFGESKITYLRNKGIMDRHKN
ncbi:polysaccharide biosynthesis C-terminal domain-containing protein [Bacillus sp. DFI.2.34]|nr:polysaccharide biosynthesis C-terminal domain-containing protein [Bacillus sp. DFI.2.34]